MIQSSNKVAVTLVLQVIRNTPDESSRKLRNIFPLTDNLPLGLTDISEKILQLGCLGGEEGQITATFDNESKIKRDKF